MPMSEGPDQAQRGPAPAQGHRQVQTAADQDLAQTTQDTWAAGDGAQATWSVSLLRLLGRHRDIGAGHTGRAPTPAPTMPSPQGGILQPGQAVHSGVLPLLFRL